MPKLIVVQKIAGEEEEAATAATAAEAEEKKHLDHSSSNEGASSLSLSSANGLPMVNTQENNPDKSDNCGDDTMADKNDSSSGGGMIHGVAAAASLVHLSKETKIDAFLSNRTKDHNNDHPPHTPKHTSNSTKAETKPQPTKELCSVKKDKNPATKRSQAIPIKEKCSINGCNSNAAEGGICCTHGGKRIRNKKICSHDGCTKDSFRGGVCWKHGGKDNRKTGDTKLQSSSEEERMKDIMEGMWSEQQSNNFMGESDNDGDGSVEGDSDDDQDDDEEEDSCNPPAWIVELNEKEDQGVQKKRNRDGQLHQSTRQSDDYHSAVSNNHQSTTTSSNNLAALDAAYRQYINKLQSEYNLNAKDIDYLASKTITNQDIERASKRQRMSTETNPDLSRSPHQSKPPTDPASTITKSSGCSCRKSTCIRLYCACFGDGKSCQDSCKCMNCKNPKGINPSSYITLAEKKKRAKKEEKKKKKKEHRRVEAIQQQKQRQRTSADTNKSTANPVVAEEKKPVRVRRRIAQKSKDEKWMDKYNALVEYYKINGANAPVPKENKPLYGWVCSQKSYRDADTLDATRVTLLNSIGFDFTMRNKPNSWEENFAELKGYREKNGSNAEYRSSGHQSNRRMYKWVKSQRRIYKEGRLKEERAQKLREIEFNFERPSGRGFRSWNGWNACLNRLLEYMSKHEQQLPSIKSKRGTDEFRTAQWVLNQRNAYINGMLSADKVERLESIIGFEFNPEGKPRLDHSDEGWEKMFNNLVEYNKEHGDCSVPYDFESEKHGLLGRWVGTMKCQFHGMVRGMYAPVDTRLSDDRTAKLVKLGFDFTIRTKEQTKNDHFNSKLRLYIQYKVKHGEEPSERSMPSLRYWCARQRQDHRIGALSQYRAGQLEEAGFPFECSNNGSRDSLDGTNEERWNARYQELKAFYETHGHCRVSSELVGSEISSKLGSWSSHQRERFRKGTLPDGRFDLLKQIEFPFVSEGKSHGAKWANEQWDSMFSRAVKLYEDKGHCNAVDDDPELANWIANMQHSNSLHEGRKQQLLQLLSGDKTICSREGCSTYGPFGGLCHEHYTVKETQKKDEVLEAWNARYQELKDFYTIYGHCQLSTALAHEKLINWANYQRQRFRDSRYKLPDDQYKLLQEVEFNFDGNKSSFAATQQHWDNIFEQVVNYYENNGHCDMQDDNPKLSHWIKAMSENKSRVCKSRQHELFQLLEGDKTICFREGCSTYGPFEGLCHKHFCEERTAMLEASQDEWKAMLGKLVTFFEENGHTNIVKDESQLRRWHAIMRMAPKLSTARKQALNLLSIGEMEKGKCCSKGCSKFALFSVDQLRYCFSCHHVKTNDFRARILDAAKEGKRAQPVAASEVDFDIEDPPESLREPSKAAVAETDADLAEHDVVFTINSEGGEHPPARNIRYSELVHDFKPFYILTPRDKKFDVAKSLVFIVQQRGGRFFHDDPDSAQFHEMTDEYAIANTMHALAKLPDNKNERGTIAAAKNFIETHNLEAQSAYQFHEAEDAKSLPPKKMKTVTVKKSKKTTAPRISREDRLERQWDATYEKIKEFFNANGHSSVTPKHNRKDLLNWSQKQRRSHKDGNMAEGHVQKLQQIDFVFDPTSTRSETFWNLNYGKLKEFYETHGHSHVYQTHNRTDLLKFTKQQRQNYRKGHISAERVEKLNQLDFVFDAKSYVSADKTACVTKGREPGLKEKWNRRYGEFVKHFETYGTCRVLKTHDNHRLLKWREKQLYNHKRGTNIVSLPEQTAQLQLLDFWNVSTDESKPICMHDDCQKYAAFDGCCHFHSLLHGQQCSLACCQDQASACVEDTDNVCGDPDEDDTGFCNGDNVEEEDDIIENGDQSVAFDAENDGFGNQLNDSYHHEGDTETINAEQQPTAGVASAEQTWENHYQAMNTFIEQHGRPPQSWEENPALYDWLQVQKERQRKLNSFCNSF